MGYTSLGGTKSWLMANETSCDHLIQVSSHLRPVKMLLENVNGLVKTKMAS